MTNEEILKRVDHTLLAPTASKAEIDALCKQAIEHKTASVCVPPSYIGYIKESFGGQVTICTVLGFPLGYDTTETKVFSAKNAIALGAQELDMVINQADVKNGEFDKITAEIAEMKKAAGAHILKVIIETCNLNDDEKISLCKCVTDAGADYIKTSTGFGSAGATLADIQLFKKHVGAGVKIKAAGGIRTREDMIAFIEAGADRLGTSSAIKILEGQAAAGY